MSDYRVAVIFRNNLNRYRGKNRNVLSCINNGLASKCIYSRKVCKKWGNYIIVQCCLFLFFLSLQLMNRIKFRKISYCALWYKQENEWNNITTRNHYFINSNRFASFMRFRNIRGISCNLYTFPLLKIDDINILSLFHAIIINQIKSTIKIWVIWRDYYASHLILIRIKQWLTIFGSRFISARETLVCAQTRRDTD